jgi:hypothetical protein
LKLYWDVKRRAFIYILKPGKEKCLCVKYKSPWKIPCECAPGGEYNTCFSCVVSEELERRSMALNESNSDGDKEEILSSEIKLMSPVKTINRKYCIVTPIENKYSSEYKTELDFSIKKPSRTWILDENFKKLVGVYPSKRRGSLADAYDQWLKYKPNLEQALESLRKISIDRKWHLGSNQSFIPHLSRFISKGYHLYSDKTTGEGGLSFKKL